MASLIHPSAHVDPKAELGATVSVGPGAVIDAGCVIGDHCEIRAHAVVTGTAVLGKNNQIGYGAIVGAEPQDMSFKKETRSRVVVGNNNVIREYATLHRGTGEGTETRVGNDNFIMAGAHVGHNARVGNKVVLVNNVLLGGYVEVQDRAFLGGGSVVHQHVRVGELAILQGLGGAGMDLPPFFMAVRINRVTGLNRVGLKRAGIGPEARRAIQNAYHLLYRSGLNTTQALEEIEKTLQGAEITRLVTFIRTSKRGICRAGAVDVDEEDSVS